MSDTGWEICFIVSRLIRPHLGNSLIKFLNDCSKVIKFLLWEVFYKISHVYTETHTREGKKSYQLCKIKKKHCEKLWDIWKPLIKQVATCANHRVALRNLRGRTSLNVIPVLKVLRKR